MVEEILPVSRASPLTFCTLTSLRRLQFLILRSCYANRKQTFPISKILLHEIYLLGCVRKYLREFLLWYLQRSHMLERK